MEILIEILIQIFGELIVQLLFELGFRSLAEPFRTDRPRNVVFAVHHRVSVVQSNAVQDQKRLTTTAIISKAERRMPPDSEVIHCSLLDSSGRMPRVGTTFFLRKAIANVSIGLATKDVS